MQMIDLVGWIASVVTLTYTAFGLPVQIRKNWAKKSTEGLSLFMTIMLFGTFTSWVVYSALKLDWYILIPNSVGAVGALVILGQFAAYRDRK